MESRPIRLAAKPHTSQRHPEAAMRHELLLLGVLSSACARSSAPSAAAPLGPEQDQLTRCAPAGGAATSSVITAAELHNVRAPNLYDVIERLRPGYFTGRGPSSIYQKPATPMVVIVNSHVFGGLTELRSMQAAPFGCVRRLSAAEVAFMTGTNAAAGGIELVYAGGKR